MLGLVAPAAFAMSTQSPLGPFGMDAERPVDFDGCPTPSNKVSFDHLPWGRSVYGSVVLSTDLEADDAVAILMLKEKLQDVKTLVVVGEGDQIKTEVARKMLEHMGFNMDCVKIVQGQMSEHLLPDQFSTMYGAKALDPPEDRIAVDVAATELKAFLRKRELWEDPTFMLLLKPPFEVLALAKDQDGRSALKSHQPDAVFYGSFNAKQLKKGDPDEKGTETIFPVVGRTPAELSAMNQEELHGRLHRVFEMERSNTVGSSAVISVKQVVPITDADGEGLSWLWSKLSTPVVAHIVIWNMNILKDRITDVLADAEACAIHKEAAAALQVIHNACAATEPPWTSFPEELFKIEREGWHSPELVGWPSKLEAWAKALKAVEYETTGEDGETEVDEKKKLVQEKWIAIDKIILPNALAAAKQACHADPLVASALLGDLRGPLGDGPTGGDQPVRTNPTAKYVVEYVNPEQSGALKSQLQAYSKNPKKDQKAQRKLFEASLAITDKALPSRDEAVVWPNAEAWPFGEGGGPLDPTDCVGATCP